MEVTMSYWQVFAALGVLLMALEVVVPGFVMLPMGIGFLLTAGVAVVIQDGPLLVAILGTFQFLIYVVFRRVLKNRSTAPTAYTNVDGMLGKTAEVTEAIPERGTGYVKLYGDRWLAQSLDGRSHAVGARVVIEKVEGNKVWVEGLID